MKRTFCLLLALLMVLLCLPSCGELSVAELETAANKKLEEAPYTVTLSMAFDFADASVKSLMEGMGMDTSETLNTKISVNGQTIIEESGSGNTKSTTIYADGWLYISEAGLKRKAQATFEEAYEHLLGGSEFEIGPATFEKQEKVRNDDKTYTVTFSDPIAAELEKVGADFGSDSGLSLSDLNGNIVYEKDGAYKDMEFVLKITIDFNTLTDGYAQQLGLPNTAEMTATLDCAYTYETVSITAPSDSASYQTVSLSALIGE